MKYLIDTNVCIRYLNGSSLSIRNKLNRLSPEDEVICSFTRAELLLGAKRSQRPEQTEAVHLGFINEFESLPFDELAATEYARIRHELEEKGTPIGPNDLLIASIALAHGLTLVTHNTREFGRVDGLKMEDWEVA